MILAAGKSKASIMPIYRRMCRFNMTFHLLILFAVHKYFFNYSCITLIAVRESEILSHSIYGLGYKKRVTPGNLLKQIVLSYQSYCSVFLVLYFLHGFQFCCCAREIFIKTQAPHQHLHQTQRLLLPQLCPPLFLALLIWSTICPLFITMFKVSFLN